MATPRQHLSIADICADLDISRRTFHEWKAKGRGPRCLKLSNGDIRVRRDEYDAWLSNCEEEAA